MARFKREKRERGVIDDAIAHLNGYASVIKALRGFIPLAILETINDLEGMKNER